MKLISNALSVVRGPSRRCLEARRVSLSVLASACLLAACGGGGAEATAPTAPTPPAAATLGGTVAVGAPITQGKLRILDSTGQVVVENLSIDADGRYAAVPLTGTGPWRIEACGTVGANYQCIYSVAHAGGTANVTPLTTAAVLLAAGQAPDTLMGNSGPVLSADALRQAQATLRSALSGVMTDAGVGGDLDFVTGSLSAGSRTGHDRLLDSLGVSTGEDQGAFVQITPRLGSGNVFLQAGAAPSGQLSVDSRASNLSLGGVETLFRDMTRAVMSASACMDAQTGLPALLASDARMQMEDIELEGRAPMALALCTFFARGEGLVAEAMWGAQFVSPVLGRCDLSGAQPVCRVSFALKMPDGRVEQVGDDMAVTLENGAWKFRGQASAVSVRAGANVQRDIRVDADGAQAVYTRAFSFEVPALPGLACARIAQRDAAGDPVLLGYFKRHGDGAGQRRLSAWRAGEFTTDMSGSPTSGTTRSADDSWIHLPDGAAGDTAIRNFYRGGRAVQVSLYSDEACSLPFTPRGGSASFEVDMAGVPPVHAALAGMAWPELTPGTVTALGQLALGAGATASFDAAWSFRRGPLGVRELTVCASRAACGEGGSGRLGQARLRFGATSGTVALNNGGPAFAASGSKTLALYGAGGDGLQVQSNYQVCTATPAGQNCPND